MLPTTGGQRDRSTFQACSWLLLLLVGKGISGIALLRSSFVHLVGRAYMAPGVSGSTDLKGRIFVGFYLFVLFLYIVGCSILVHVWCWSWYMSVILLLFFCLGFAVFLVHIPFFWYILYMLWCWCWACVHVAGIVLFLFVQATRVHIIYAGDQDLLSGNVFYTRALRAAARPRVQVEVHERDFEQ